MHFILTASTKTCMEANPDTTALSHTGNLNVESISSSKEITHHYIISFLLLVFSQPCYIGPFIYLLLAFVQSISDVAPV